MLDLLESLFDLAALWPGRKGNRGRYRGDIDDGCARKARCAIDDRRLLDHPFYKAWAAGELSRDDLGFYSTQYWRQVETFPTCLRAVTSRLEDSRARRAVEENLSDELDVEHSNELAGAIAEVAGDEDDLAEAEARAGADAIWTLLDGVERVRTTTP